MGIKPLRYYFFIVLLMHLFLLIISSLGLNFRKNIIQEERVITIDVVPVKAISNIKTVKTETDKSVQNEKAKHVIKSVPEIEKQQIKDKEELDTKEEIKKPTKKTEEKIPEKKPKDQVKKKVEKKDEKSPSKKPQKKIQQTMKTIEKSSDGIEEKSKKQNREQTEPDKSEALGKEDTDMELSINERQLIHDKIDSNWDRGFLTGTLENIEITMEISFSYDGSLSNPPIIKSYNCPGLSSNICEAAIRSVVTAILKSSPILGLPIDRYEAWKDTIITFSPQ